MISYNLGLTANGLIKRKCQEFADYDLEQHESDNDFL